MKILYIQYEIEQRRAEMISLSKEYSMTSDEVIGSSKHLDHLLNEYQHLKATSSKKLQRNTYDYMDDIKING